MVSNKCLKAANCQEKHMHLLQEIKMKCLLITMSFLTDFKMILLS